MSSTQEQGLAAVPPQGRPADAVAAPEVPQVPEVSETTQQSELSKQSEPSKQSKQSRQPKQSEAPKRSRTQDHEPEPERMPLLARVLLADLAVAVVALILLFVIEVQRFGDASLHLRRQAWTEDLVVLFFVSLVFGVVTYLLLRARHIRVAVVQAVVTALVLAAAVTSAATGSPQPSPDSSTTVSTTGNPG